MILLSGQGCFATSWQFRYTHDGVEGVLAVYSCGASKRAQKARAGLPPGMEAPHWEHFQGCWFPNVFLGDFIGMMETRWVWMGELGCILDTMVPNGRVLFEQKYGQ